MHNPKPLAWALLTLLAFFTAPMLRADNMPITLDISKFDKPNTKAEGWTESGIGTAVLSYTHDSGVTVTFRTANENSGVIVRTYVNGVGALGIDDPLIDFQEAMTVSITGIEGTAEISSFSFVALDKFERVQITAPALIFYQQNGGKIAPGIDSGVVHDDAKGITSLIGQLEDSMQTSSVEFFGPEDRKGFSFASSHEVKFQIWGKKWNCAFTALSFHATPTGKG